MLRISDLPEKIIRSLENVNYDYNRRIENTSPWNHVIDLLCYHASHDNDASCDEHFLQEIAHKFAERIIIDKQILESKTGEVSECALFCPSWGSRYDKIFGITSLIAFRVFPKLEPMVSDSDHEIEITNDFAKLLTSLRKSYKTAMTKRKNIDDAFKTIIHSDKRHQFDVLKRLPISDHILYPSASPIESEALGSVSIEPLVKYLETNTTFIVDDAKSTEYIDSTTAPNIVFEKGCVYGDGRLDVCFQDLCVDELIVLFTALKKHLNNGGFIEHVLLGNNPQIGDQGAKILSSFMQNDNKIKTWYVCGCNISDQGISLIADALRDSKIVESLWLKRNPLSPQGIRYIGEMMKTNKFITVLDLSNTGMLDQGCEYLFQGLATNTTLDSLYIGMSGITDIGVRVVAEYFNKLKEEGKKRITNLYIDVNRLDDQGAEILCKALSGYPLERLSIGSNRLSDSGISCVLDTFVDSKSLIFLDIGSCKAATRVHELPNNLSMTGVSLIVKFIKRNKSVKIMNFKHIGITADGFGKMLDELDDSSSGSFADNRIIMKIFLNQAGVQFNSMNSHKIMNHLRPYLQRNIMDIYGVSEKDFNQHCAGSICHCPLIKYIENRYISDNTR